MLRLLRKNLAFILYFALTLTALVLSGCDEKSVAENITQNETVKLKVFVTFDALKEFVCAVGGENVEVKSVAPEGNHAHDCEPKAHDLSGLANADIFVYNGLGMESWADETINAVNNDGLIVVEASKGADIIQNAEQYDPHIWLSLKEAQTQVNNIKDALITADGANSEYYQANAEAFTAQLESLFNEYYVKFADIDADKKSFVTGHAAFGYLCRDFGLEQNSVVGLFSDGEPTARQLRDLAEYCRKNSVTTIFAENSGNAAISAVLAKEVGAKVETVYTIEVAEDNLSYLERMEYNLKKIYNSMK